MRLWMLCVCILSLFFNLGAADVVTENSAIELISKGPRLQELIFHVSPEDLNLSEEGISLNVDGGSHAVHSVKKEGNGWIAKASPHGNCAWGHPLW